MTIIKDVFLKNNLEANSFIFKRMSDSYFADKAVTGTALQNIVKNLIDSNLFDCTLESITTEEEIKQNHCFFKPNTDTLLFSIELIKKGILEKYIPRIRDPKSFKDYNRFIDASNANIKQPYLQFVLGSCSRLIPNNQQDYRFDVDIDDSQYNVMIECCKTKLYIQFSVDPKEIKKT